METRGTIHYSSFFPLHRRHMEFQRLNVYALFLSYWYYLFDIFFREIQLHFFFIKYMMSEI